MSIWRRDFVSEQGRKTGSGGPNEAFSDAGLVQKHVLSVIEGIKLNGMTYFLSVTYDSFLELLDV